MEKKNASPIPWISVPVRVALEQPDQDGADDVDDRGQPEREHDPSDQATVPFTPRDKALQLLDDHAASLRARTDDAER